MIEKLLPLAVSSVETHVDIAISLFPAESRAINDASTKRRNEFATVRACARAALEALGHEAVPIPPGPDRAPIWPPGIVGSMTHCDGYRAAAVARQPEIAFIGIDAEPNAPLPHGVAPLIRAKSDSIFATRTTGVPLAIDRLLFSAKEAVFKAWYPLKRPRLDFTDVSVALNPDGTFSSQLHIGVQSAQLPFTFDGRWIATDTHLITAVTSPTASVSQRPCKPWQPHE